MFSGSRELRQLASELDDLRRRLGSYDDAVQSDELARLGESVRRISRDLRERAVLLGADVTAHVRRDGGE